MFSDVVRQTHKALVFVGECLVLVTILWGLRLLLWGGELLLRLLELALVVVAANGGLVVVPRGLLEVLTAATATSEPTTSAAAALCSVLGCAVPTVTEVVAEVVVLGVSDNEQFDEAVANVLLVLLAISCVTVFLRLELDNSFTCGLAIVVLADFD